MPIIAIRNLVKKFGDLVAVDGISLEIEGAECFGLLGPNGAGKTSLVRMMTGVSPITQGEIWIDGKNLKKQARQIKATIGVVPQIDNLDPDLSVLQNLVTFARYFDIPKDEAWRRAREVLELVQLDDKRHSGIRELSGGMKRRLLIARGLMNRPRILVMDEPTIGLDPQAKYLVWHKLSALKAQGVTQLLCTQNMDEAALLCDRIAIMHQGHLLALNTLQQLVSTYVGQEVWEIDVLPTEKAGIKQELTRQGVDFEDAGGSLHIVHAERLGQRLDRTINISRRRPANLEDVFFKLTGRSLVE